MKAECLWEALTRTHLHNPSDTLLVPAISLSIVILSVWSLVSTKPSDLLIDFAQQHSVMAPLLFILARLIATVIPAIPNLPFSLIAMAFFGWWQAMIYATFASTVGAIINFLIARHFRYSLISRFTSLNAVLIWEKRLSQNQRFWSFVSLRLMSEFIADFVSYAAGLTSMKIWQYTLATILGDLPWKFLVFYFGGRAVQQGGIAIIVFLVGAFMLYLWSSASSLL